MQSQSASWFDLCIASQFAPGGLRVQFCKQLCKWEKSSPPLAQTLTSSSALRAWSSTPHPGKITWKWWPFPNFTWPQRQCLISLCYSESRWTTGKESRDLQVFSFIKVTQLFALDNSCKMRQVVFIWHQQQKVTDKNVHKWSLGTLPGGLCTPILGHQLPSVPPRIPAPFNVGFCDNLKSPKTPGYGA